MMNKNVRYYLYDRRIIFTYLIGVYVLFFVIFKLYGVHTEIILYSTVVAVVVGIPALYLDYKRYMEHMTTLDNLHKQFEHQDTFIMDKDHLPRGYLNIEKAYVQLVEDMIEATKIFVSNQDGRYSEMMDYYTLWAHQIKTPIAAMKLLLQTDANEDQKKLLNQLFKIEQYVEMVLVFLKIEDSSSDLLIGTFDLERMVTQSVKKYATLFIREKTKLQLNLCETKVVTDEKWLVFAIEQIISNSIKYTGEGTVKIYIADKNSDIYESWFYQSKRNATTLLVIEDNGIGISKEDLPRVFDKGFTGYNGRTDKKATGIGLYMTKKVLDKLGHGLHIDSVMGKGTRVYISF